VSRIFLYLKPLSLNSLNYPILKMAELDFHDHTLNKNPVVKFLVRDYFKRFDNLLRNLPVNSALDVGCGNGYVTNHLGRLIKTKMVGLDIDSRKIKSAKSLYNSDCYLVSDGRNMPFRDDSFDLVLSTEVLEHQRKPEKLMNEIIRTSRQYGFFSVPYEPYWRACNMLRGKFWKTLGNNPEHVQHWGKKSFQNFLGNFFEKVVVSNSNIWLMALCEKPCHKNI